MIRKTAILGIIVAIVSGLFALHPGVVTAAGETVNIWMTTPDQSKLLAQQASVNFAANSGSNPLTITVNPATKYQTMDGWGASFTDSSAWLVWNKLSSTTRNTLMNDLFSKSSGIGLSMLRQPLGASDFSSKGNYSYDDGSADPSLSRFSISPDTAYVIPVVKQAISINSSIKVIGTPWSPPGWMKTSGSMIGGNLLSSQYSDALAQYFVKFIQAYQAQGIPIYGITVQNEPLYIPGGYPGMGMAAADQGGFIGYNLGPALANAGLSTKIMVYDHNWDQISYPTTVYQNSAAYNYVAGVAWHCYGGDISAELNFHNSYPNKDTWLTECSGGNWAPYYNDFGANLKGETENLVILNARYWGKGAILWNMALDTNNGPTNGGCTTCRGIVTINQSNGTYTKTVDYYVLGQASKFVDSGAYHIDSNSFGSSSIEDVAFQNPDGSLVVLALNNASSSQTFKVVWGSQAFSYTLPAGAVATFKWNPGSVVTEQPYGGTRASIPGKVEAENYDTGGEGLAYHDSDVANSGGQYRTGEGVDIEATTDSGAGYNVGWTATGEWTKYMVNMTSGGTYNIDFRVASANTGSTLHLEVDGANVSGTITVPNTGGWQTWQTVTKSNVSLTAGSHTLRLYIDNGGMNINYLNFTLSTPPTFVPPTNTPAPVTNTPVPPTNTPIPSGISPTAWYNVINQNSNKCVDATGWGTTNGTSVQQWACGNASYNQEWQFQPTDSGYFKVINRNAQGLAWDVTGGTSATQDGALIQLWTYGGGANQQWMPVALGGGYYKFVARHSGKCLDVTGVSTADGVQLQQWTCTGGTAQSFRLAQQP